jgi:pyrroloquinoline quinone biosynthesis protein B
MVTSVPSVRDNGGMSYSLLILGSGQDGGSPQVGSASSTGIERTASSVAVFSDDGPVLLFDASPDLRTQYQRLADQCGYAPRLDGVFITHGHMGHYAGLVHFGKEAAATDGLPLFAPQSVLSFLASNEPWASLLSQGNVDPVPIDDVQVTIDDLGVTAIPVPHRAEHTGTVGYSIAVRGKPWAFYLPDIDGWHEWPEAADVMAAHEVCLVDATFSSPDELPGRDLAAIKHPFVPDTIERFGDLTDSRMIVLTHINHSNPLGDDDSAITSRALDAGFIIAHDGLVISHD